jgi:meso-butanediol dehydrogenase/(S,S)-butanediol dehydrogenase/diacetyl reductase
MALALARQGVHVVTVNAVCPGILGAAMWLDHLLDRRVERRGDDRQAAFEQYASSLMPLGRPQTPEDIGAAVVYLARADNVTGIALNVAGGLVMH